MQGYTGKRVGEINVFILPNLITTRAYLQFLQLFPEADLNAGVMSCQHGQFLYRLCLQL